MRTQQGARSRHIVLASLVLAAGASLAMGDFEYADFSSIDGLTLLGNAGTRAEGDQSMLQITNGADQISSIWHDARQMVVSEWSTEFVFSVHDINRRGADGFAFVVQNASGLMHEDTSFGRGGGIGYNMGSNLVAVEFDFWQNAGALDPNDNHISIHNAGPGVTSSHEDDSIGIATNIPDMSTGELFTARIDYTPGQMTVSLNGQQIITADIDLSTALDTDGGAWLGFTGATTAAWQTNEIHTWSFTGEPIPAPAGAAVLALGLAGLSRRRR